MSTSKGIVTVTGASGYIAGHVLKQLIAKGYTVRGTVRSLSNEYKVKHLQEDFPGIELFEADLLTPGSFDKAIEGADFVMHTASPFQLRVDDPQKDLVEPAQQGTLNVLESCKKAGVKRVVVTSSCAAVMCNSYAEDKVHTEEDWNTDSTLTDGPYRLSKTLAEKAAWEFAEANSIDVVVINPSFVLGPPCSNRVDSTSVATIKGMLEGKFKDNAMATGFGCVHVSDVAQAHVEAMERPDAKGRHLLTSNLGFSHLSMAQALASAPALAAFKDRLPTTEMSTPVLAKYDHSKAERELGIVFKEPATAVIEMAEFLIANGIVSADAPADSK